MRLLLALLVAAMFAGCLGAADTPESPPRTIHLKMWIEDLVGVDIYPGFQANLWAFCAEAADSNDAPSVAAVELWQGETCSVPGPTLRVREGDHVIVDFRNSHVHHHTIHWHGQHTPWASDGVPGSTQDSVKPGEVFTYDFHATRTGTLWYHCHVDTQFHVMQGLYGMFIVEPQDDRYEPKDIDKEFTYVYSTLHRDLVEVTPITIADPHAQHRHGGCGMSGRQGCQNPAADTTADTWLLNGRSLPYSVQDREDTVMVVEEGDRVRLRILNAGETVEAIHTHGHDMLVTHIDGNPIPPSARYYVDTLFIGPASRYDVTIDMDQPGIWVMHTHVDHHVTNSHQAPGGGFSFIAYQSVLDEYNGELRNFAGAELPGGSPLVLPLEIPVDTQLGGDRSIGNNLPSDPSPVNVDTSWSFGWELPCATRYIRVTAEYDAGVPDGLADAVLDLAVQLVRSNGDLVEGASGTIDGAARQFSWILDGRYDALDQNNREIKAQNRQTMISNLQSSSKTASNVIESCMSDMDMSVQQASSANSAMEEIQALILEISHMSTHISQAAAEQSETSGDIARNIEDINHIADASYQAMSSIAEASQNLTVLANQQGDLVHQFKL